MHKYIYMHSTTYFLVALFKYNIRIILTQKFFTCLHTSTRVGWDVVVVVVLHVDVICLLTDAGANY